nr:MAG TPA: hypothetical protein [Caudoviricetes sp.]
MLSNRSTEQWYRQNPPPSQIFLYVWRGRKIAVTFVTFVTLSFSDI